ncbi:MAG TPA: cytochrome P450 [Candidatus Limnocylindrales bacterium]
MSLPRPLMIAAFIFLRRRVVRLARKRYGPTFTMDLPTLGPSVFLTDPVLIRQLFTTGPDLIGNTQPNLGRVLGPGSFFNLDGEDHRRQRKLLVPPFHGRRMKAYESIIEEETLRETANWPQGKAFPTLPSTMRITLNAILRAVFGAEGAHFTALRELLPPMVSLASRLAILSNLAGVLGYERAWERYRGYRRRFDAIVSELISAAESDPDLDLREDVLSLMLQARYDDGAAMSHSDIGDQLYTLLAAGHETTATTLAWAFERIRRHPALLERLVREADEGGSELRQATFIEVQRTRPVIDQTGRRVKAEHLKLGEWIIPKGYNVIASIGMVHTNESVFPNAAAFDPDRFVGAPPDSYSWIPFGGGTRRCIGAAFATMEMDVVLRTVLRCFTIEPTSAAGERWHSRGVAFAPAKGGKVVVHRRSRA